MLCCSVFCVVMCPVSDIYTDTFAIKKGRGMVLHGNIRKIESGMERREYKKIILMAKSKSENNRDAEIRRVSYYLHVVASSFCIFSDRVVNTDLIHSLLYWLRSVSRRVGIYLKRLPKGNHWIFPYQRKKGSAKRENT
ncbi:uncharacterized protein LOC111692259 [Anoplophora glabripennis]|uniref:uncharacterized protein LOC111692259 n=1 Tax=Anoplophora glabripennis TaxID=217634 RepID=UPI000C78B08D|nr:uncharacterized protein LOC111692259 [Anoplophora glabripennis]